MLWMAIITPVIGAAYLMGQIHKRDLRGWQHYACLTSLIFLISILFLVASGKVQSFDVAGNNIRLVDQKLDEIKALTQQNQLLAKQTAEVIIRSVNGLIADESFDEKGVNQSIDNLLRTAGMSDADIKKFLIDLKQSSSKTNSP
jgi:hypothetical protein